MSPELLLLIAVGTPVVGLLVYLLIIATPGYGRRVENEIRSRIEGTNT